MCVCVLMKWREGLALQDRGRDTLRGSEQRVNWIEQGVYGPSLFMCVCSCMFVCIYVFEHNTHALPQSSLSLSVSLMTGNRQR